MFACLALSGILPAPVHASCREIARQKVAHRFGGPAAAGIGGAALVSSGFVMPVMAISIGLYFLWTSGPRRFVRFMDQAEVCQGNLIGRIYLDYRRHTATPVSFSEFCSRIHEGDLDESLCLDRKLPDAKRLRLFLDGTD